MTDYSGFICKDKLVLELQEKTENRAFQVASNHDNELRVCTCLIGNADVPAGAEVLVPALVVPPNGKTQLPDGRQVYVVDMARVVAWRASRCAPSMDL